MYFFQHSIFAEPQLYIFVNQLSIINIIFGDLSKEKRKTCFHGTTNICRKIIFRSVLHTCPVF